MWGVYRPTSKGGIKLSVFQGDFLGFQFGQDHSYKLNITRVSTNDRYQDTLLPTFTDAVVQVPGGDGTYYWDTYYTQKPFTIDFAFDDLRDEDLRSLRQMFSSREIKPLIFDEFPYKKYMVKCAQPPILKFICFDQYEFRIYKGEGTVSFVAYYPFAFSVISPDLAYSNQGSIINNSGDLPANLDIIFSLDNLPSVINLELRDSNKETIGKMTLENVITQSENDKYILINSQTQLIEGLDKNKKKTGKLYNRFITSGDFFWSPVGRSYLVSSTQFENANYTPLYF